MYIDESTGTYYQEKDKVDVVDIVIIAWNSGKSLKDNIRAINLGVFYHQNQILPHYHIHNNTTA